MFVNGRHGAGKRRGNGSRRQLSRALSARIDEVRVPRRRGTVQVAQERADEWQRQSARGGNTGERVSEVVERRSGRPAAWRTASHTRAVSV